MLDTTSPHDKLILAVLGALAEFERSMILARTADGRARAQASGVRFGRKPEQSPFQIDESLRRRAAGEALTEIGQIVRREPLDNIEAVNDIRRPPGGDRGPKPPTKGSA